MRIAVLSDIHANVQALDAVLAHAEAQKTEAIWQLGDIVGYGPDPDAVIRRLKEMGALGVMGNHDAAAITAISTKDFNKNAAKASSWTARNLSSEGKTYLRSLPEVESEGEYTRVHGSLREPLWEYLRSYDAVLGHFELQETMYSFVGHTHLPLVLRETEPGRFAADEPGDGVTVELSSTERTCINPGGVGQPRDGDPRSAYAVLDTAAATITFHRVAYDFTVTQRKMREVGLPEPLAARLEFGR